MASFQDGQLFPQPPSSTWDKYLPGGPWQWAGSTSWGHVTQQFRNNQPSYPSSNWLRVTPEPWKRALRGALRTAQGIWVCPVDTSSSALENEAVREIRPPADIWESHLWVWALTKRSKLKMKLRNNQYRDDIQTWEKNKDPWDAELTERPINTGPYVEKLLKNEGLMAPWVKRKTRTGQYDHWIEWLNTMNRIDFDGIMDLYL